MEKKLYIRFGEIPDGEKSAIYSYQEQKIVGSEDGVSVYNCCKIGDDWRIVLPTQCKESTLDTLYGLLVDGKDIYVLSGDEVGIGSDNEPLIRNCSIVCKLPNNYFSLLIENEEIVQVTEQSGGNMNLNKKELKWLRLAIEDNNKYHIAVDNDCISIDECVDEENDEWDSVFVFDNYGQDLIVQLFNYIGCNAIMCKESEQMTREERLKELELEYAEFIETDSGKKWLDDCKSRNNGQTGDCGDYIYDFYPEVLM